MNMKYKKIDRIISVISSVYYIYLLYIFLSTVAYHESDPLATLELQTFDSKAPELQGTWGRALVWNLDPRCDGIPRVTVGYSQPYQFGVNL